MWRINNLTENEDSDQSISEEEDFQSDCPDNYVSLGGHAEREVGINQAGLRTVVDVENPAFNNEGDLSHLRRRASTFNLDDEIISDDEIHHRGSETIQKVFLPKSGSIMKNGACTWSAATREAEELVHLIGNAGCSSSNDASAKANRSAKGGKGKKPKFSFHFQSRKDDHPSAVKIRDETHMSSTVFSLQEVTESVDHRNREHSMSEILEFFQEGKVEQSEICALPTEKAGRNNNRRHSIAEDQENNGLQRSNFKEVSSQLSISLAFMGLCFEADLLFLQGNVTKGGRTRLVLRRNSSQMSDRNMDDDVTLEDFVSGPSSDDEDHRGLKLIIPESKTKSMADQFQEALGASSLNDMGVVFALPRQPRITEPLLDWPNVQHWIIWKAAAGSCIDVRIMSKHLEAKLNVCSCSVAGDDEGSQWVDNRKMIPESGGRTLTVIFSLRSCSDIELEVGKLIRIRPPWKEVPVVGKDETIIFVYSLSELIILEVLDLQSYWRSGRWECEQSLRMKENGKYPREKIGVDVYINHWRDWGLGMQVELVDEVEPYISKKRKSKYDRIQKDS
ncbi:hypothetical protein RJ639_000457 [Escallonia herrerae]|uniref:Uncharacterized protein n=1 Tax=Escallonia herrerae TaxID=1293975 RepID=A0AA88XMH2_9ASTE|nr:hypothetical protein RJ639_000457 [Escallonia herrerae]